MFEKETRLKIEWQDPKTMRDLDTCLLPSSLNNVGINLLNMFVKKLSLSSFTFNANAQNAP